MKQKREGFSAGSSTLIWSLLISVLTVSLLMQPGQAAAAAITCSSGLSGCHFQNNKVKDGTARNTPDGYVPGTHARHSGYSTSSTKREYKYACTQCHGLASGYTNAHQSGFKNISGAALTGSAYSQGKKIANTNNPTFGNCGTTYCHSTGRATGMGQKQYSSSKWGGTEGCLGCHAGRVSAAGNPARSVGNFTLSTTHSQHLKYPAANMNCNVCHYKTATDAATLKSFSAATRHVNGVRDVTFIGVAYGTYTSYKSTEAGSAGNTKTCNNLSCHGGKSRSAWNATTTNNNYTCVHCHGVGNTVSGTDNRAFAPGFKRAGVVGTSTDQNFMSSDLRVGAHFKHLSSLYTKNVKCNECHKVPYNVFDAGHIDSPRFSSTTITFAQASTASKNGATMTFTVGNASTAAQCSTLYCHGSNMPKGDTSGTYRTPFWNASTAIQYTVPNNACGTCHGNPPTAGTTAATHSGKAATTSCSGCHAMMVDATGKIIDKTLHINGVVNVTADCNGCHKYDTTGTNTWSSVTVGTDVAHYKHIAFIKTRLGYGALAVTSQTFGTSAENVAVCGTCHTTTLSLHNNGAKNVTFGAGGTYPNTMGGGTASSMSLLLGGSNPVANGTSGSNITCSNLMCHYATTPNWYTAAP